MLLRPISDGDEAALLCIHRAPEVVRWWGEPEAGFPLSDDRDAKRFAIVLDGQVAGLIEYREELAPRYRHATIDLFLDPDVHGHGHGTEAVRRMVAYLISRGHHRVTIDPACDNAVAIRAYEKAGFRAVGVMRSYERDAHGERWHDGLLMDLIAGEQQLGDVARLTDPLADA
ncbi:MAG: GNAT family N-acetyltransferase [Solirubrobacteraceae bacterium]